MSVNTSLKDNKTPLIVFFFIGSLSICYAEVYSGSSPLWFLTIWGWIITFELYLAHLLFYLNIAIRKKKLSLTHLYLLGCLVGLYEGPITKVLWHGYPDQTADHFFLGFAIIEFLMLVFFWHPIFSFMIPIIIFELLSIPYLHDHNTPSFLENSFFFTNQRRTKAFFVIIALIGATLLSVNAGFNLAITLTSGLVNVILLLLLSRTLLRSDDLRGVNSLKLSNKWFKIVFLYLVFLYSLTFFAINPQFIPSPFTLFLTLLIYLFIYYVFSNYPIPEVIPRKKSSPFKFQDFIKNSWAIWLLLLIIFPFIAGLVIVGLIISYLSLVVFGTLLFIVICAKYFIPDRNDVPF